MPLMSTLLEELTKKSRRILIEGLDASADSNVEQLWVAESKRRYQAYIRGEIEACPGAEVMTRARKRLG